MVEAATQPQKKIVFTGLDNSGKTSIVATLEAERFIKANIKPTTFVERKEFKFLDYTIMIHDLGGQKKYLIKYLKQADKFLDNTDVCIYVIDIQDFARFYETLEYAKDLFAQFTELNVKPKIYVYLHKAETMLNGDMQAAKNVDLLQERILDLNAGRFKIEFENTTIYDTYTITASFSAILQDLYPRDVLVQKTMKEFAERLAAVAVVLFDRRVITIADYFADPKDKEITQFCATYMQSFQNSLNRFPNVKAARLKIEVENFEAIFLENASDPKTYLFILSGKGKMPPLDTVHESISAILPELFVMLRIALKNQ
jgi:GTPase SAR1 family protein